MRRVGWLQGQLVLFTRPFTWKGKTFAPYYLTSSFISGNCISAGFPMLRNFRTYFAALLGRRGGVTSPLVDCKSKTGLPHWRGEAWIIIRTTRLDNKTYFDTSKLNTRTADLILKVYKCVWPIFKGIHSGLPLSTFFFSLDFRFVFLPLHVFDLYSGKIFLSCAQNCSGR